MTRETAGASGEESEGGGEDAAERLFGAVHEERPHVAERARGSSVGRRAEGGHDDEGVWNDDATANFEGASPDCPPRIVCTTGAGGAVRLMRSGREGGAKERKYGVRRALLSMGPLLLQIGRPSSPRTWRIGA